MLGLQPFNIITHKKETIRFRMEAVEVRAAPTTGPTQASHNWLEVKIHKHELAADQEIYTIVKASAHRT